jgi:hypothetical protein
MKSILRKNIFAATLAGAVALSTSLLAQEAASTSGQAGAAKPTTELDTSAPKSDPWRFSFDLIGWGPAVSGDVTVRGHNVNVDESLDDLLDDLKGIAMLGFELRKEKFGFYAQPNWIKLKEDGNVGPLNSTLHQELWIVDAAGFYQIHKWCEEKPLTLDALVGVRYWHLDHELTVKGTDGVVNFNGCDSNYLIDPIIGLRAKKYFTQKFSLSLHGDVGGFGASDNSSDLSWQAVGTLGYDFTRHFSVDVGYRALSVDKDSGSGANAKGMDVILHGFLLALDFHW